MTIDPGSLAAEISEDLTASELPDDLRSLPKSELEEIHAVIIRDIEDVKRRCDLEEADRQRRRLEAIHQIKLAKLSKVENELGRRWALLPSSDAPLAKWSYAELHERQGKVVADLQALKPRLKGLEEAPEERSEFYRIKALVRYRKAEQRRLIKEFARRKKDNLNQDRFLVRRVSAEPEELEEYLNANVEKGCARWPHDIVGMGDHVLVVWKTREPPGAEKI